MGNADRKTTQRKKKKEDLASCEIPKVMGRLDDMVAAVEAA